MVNSPPTSTHLHLAVKSEEVEPGIINQGSVGIPELGSLGAKSNNRHFTIYTQTQGTLHTSLVLPPAAPNFREAHLQRHPKPLFLHQRGITKRYHPLNMPPQLPTRKLGKHGPEVTALGFGTMGLSAFYGKVKQDEERFALLDHAYASGCLNWDTADSTFTDFSTIVNPL